MKGTKEIRVWSLLGLFVVGRRAKSQANHEIWSSGHKQKRPSHFSVVFPFSNMHRKAKSQDFKSEASVSGSEFFIVSLRTYPGLCSLPGSIFARNHYWNMWNAILRAEIESDNQYLVRQDDAKHTQSCNLVNLFPNPFLQTDFFLGSLGIERLEYFILFCF